MLKENGEESLSVDRPYWHWYLNKVAVAEKQQQEPFPNSSGLDLTPFNHLKPGFPPVDDLNLAPKMAKILQYIVNILDDKGRSKYTVAEILSKFPLKDQ
jgi:hypothetical protein